MQSKHVTYIDQVLDTTPPNPVINLLVDKIMPEDSFVFKIPALPKELTGFKPCCLNIIDAINYFRKDTDTVINREDLWKILTVGCIASYVWQSYKIELRLDYLGYKILEMVIHKDVNTYSQEHASKFVSRNIIKTAINWTDCDNNWKKICEKCNWPFHASETK
jgi:hypothetical protein